MIVFNWNTYFLMRNVSCEISYIRWLSNPYICIYICMYVHWCCSGPFTEASGPESQSWEGLAYIYIYTYIILLTNIYIYIYMYRYMYIFAFILWCVCFHSYAYVYIYIYIHIFTYICYFDKHDFMCSLNRFSNGPGNFHSDVSSV